MKDLSQFYNLPAFSLFITKGQDPFIILTILTECVLSAPLNRHMIQAENIHKSYGAVEVLKGVSLDIKKGEIVSSCWSFGGR